jgi:hypothetical protein
MILHTAHSPAYVLELDRLTRAAGGGDEADALVRVAALARIADALNTQRLISLALRIKVETLKG